MKKTLIVVSSLILVFSAFCACSKKNDDTIIVSPNTDVSVSYSTTAAEHTAGQIEYSKKVDASGGENTDDKEYEIGYFDANGAGVKLEHYKNNKLRYYYVCTSIDSEGNCIQQKYYNSRDKLIGTFDNGFFFDVDGNQITEDEMDLLLAKLY